jgi:hypothetical protein
MNLKLLHETLSYNVNIIIFKFSKLEKKKEFIYEEGEKFLKLQNMAKKYDVIGDLRSSMYISEKSYNHLGLFTTYCNILGLNQVSELEKISKKFTNTMISNG